MIIAEFLQPRRYLNSDAHDFVGERVETRGLALFQGDFIPFEGERWLGRVVAIVESSAERLGDLGRKSSELFGLKISEISIDYIDAYTGSAGETSEPGHDVSSVSTMAMSD